MDSKREQHRTGLREPDHWQGWCAETLGPLGSVHPGLVNGPAMRLELGVPPYCCSRCTQLDSSIASRIRGASSLLQRTVGVRCSSLEGAMQQVLPVLKTCGRGALAAAAVDAYWPRLCCRGSGGRSRPGYGCRVHRIHDSARVYGCHHCERPHLLHPWLQCSLIASMPGWMTQIAWACTSNGCELQRLSTAAPSRVSVLAGWQDLSRAGIPLSSSTTPAQSTERSVVFVLGGPGSGKGTQVMQRPAALTT